MIEEIAMMSGEFRQPTIQLLGSLPDHKSVAIREMTARS